MRRLPRRRGDGDEVGLTKRGKGVKILAIVDRHGLPLSVRTHAANHHEVTLVQLSFDFYMLEAKPELWCSPEIKPPGLLVAPEIGLDFDNPALDAAAPGCTTASSPE